MALILLLPVLSLVLGSIPGPSALPMTDYSQLNHDEPTHWTKAATTGGTESVKADEEQVTTASGIWAENVTEPVSNKTGSLEPEPPTPVELHTTEGTVFEETTTEELTTLEQTTTEQHTTTEPTTPEPSTRLVPTSTEATTLEIKTTEPTTTEPTSTEATTSEKAYEEQYYRYDVDDIRSLFTGDEITEKQEMSDDDMDKVLNNNFRKPEEKLPADYKEGFDSEQEEEEIRRNDALLPTVDDNYDTPFKKWDRESEEQEKLLENIVYQTNDTFDMEIERDTESPSRWFLLLLAGNSTIVRLRQKDFAKYLKLNLAARLSLEYDEVKVNKVVLAPPRLMVNVSVVPSGTGNLDDEFDLNERLFGEEEAPLHKLAETNATLLELSGEEYHVVRFLSLRSQQPVSLDEASAETIAVTDRHSDIESIIYIGIGGACLILIIPLVMALCRLYIIPIKIKWPWKRDKLFPNLPRHQRMTEPPSGPLVIYSGAFVDRNGPPSGSWIEENYARDEQKLENPLDTMIDPGVLENPKFQVDSRLHILGCRPNHLLLPHTPVRHKNLDVRITRGLDNPNYQT